MSIALITTGGFGNGTLTTTMANVTTRGYTQESIATPTAGIFATLRDLRPYASLNDDRLLVALDDDRPFIKVRYDN